MHIRLFAYSVSILENFYIATPLVGGIIFYHGRAVPVIAAGGVYTGADIRKFLDLGAAGVQMGTRFVATHECDADDRFKQSYLNAREEDVTIISSPVGMPGRALNNGFIEAAREGLKKPFKCIFHCVSTCQQEKTPYCIAQALISAMRGNLERGFAFCGENVSRVSSIVSVRELMESLQREFDEAGASPGKHGRGALDRPSYEEAPKAD